jgi:RHS repeat-associated protein
LANSRQIDCGKNGRKIEAEQWAVEMEGERCRCVRYYDPATGMFLSRDPVEGVMGRAMSYNGYSYVEGNPVRYTDPSGQCIWDGCIAEGIALIGLIGFGYGVFDHTLRYDAAARSGYDPDHLLSQDRNSYIFGGGLQTAGGGLLVAGGLDLFPEAALPVALLGTGLAGAEVLSAQNDIGLHGENEYNRVRRNLALFNFGLGAVSLPFAAGATSEALNSRLWFLSQADPLFHPDVVYPQVQGYLWQQLAGSNASASIVDNSSAFYSQFRDAQETANPISTQPISLQSAPEDQGVSLRGGFGLDTTAIVCHSTCEI